MSGYAYDTDPTSAASPGHLRRQKWVNHGDFAQFSANLNLDIFNQSRLLLNYVDFKLIAYLNEPKFVIDAIEIATDKDEYTYEIANIKLMLHEYELAPAASTAIEQILKERKMITYPLNSVAMRSFYIGEGRYDAPECRLLTSSLPKRIIVCLVEAEAYLGSYRKTPFNFGYHNVKDIFIEANGRTIPARPQNLNFAKDHYMSAFLNMVEGTGMGRSTGNNGITREMFKSGFAIFVFELSPTLESETFDLVELGTTSFKILFDTLEKEDVMR